MSTNTQLDALGWRVNTPLRFTKAVEDFQRGWRLGTPLVLDGLPGPKTRAALKRSYDNLIAGKSTASAHFSFSEFTCHCGGKYVDCARIHILAGHISRLEVYRSRINSPVYIVSGYRCKDHNAFVGGATNSQHKYGAATDIKGHWQTPAVRALHLFAGLGYQSSTGKVVHVDSRDLSINNPTHSTRTNPAMWKYAT